MDVLTVKQAAKALGVTPSRVYAMIESGRLPAEKFARVWMVDRADVDRLAREERKPGRPPKRKS